MTLQTTGILEEVRAERNKQDAKWGAAHDNKHTLDYWILILRDRLCDIALKPSNPRKAFIQVAAVAVAAVEAIDRQTPGKVIEVTEEELKEDIDRMNEAIRAAKTDGIEAGLEHLMKENSDD